MKKLLEVVLLLLIFIQCKKALMAGASAGVSSVPAAAWMPWDTDLKFSTLLYPPSEETLGL